MRVVLLDGYTDEPACLGVPPYISPYVRLCYGAAKAAGARVDYLTVDQWREDHMKPAVSYHPRDVGGGGQD